MTGEAERPLAGCRVLITRAADDAAPLRRRLEALGADVFELPAIEIAAPEDTAPLDEALRTLDSFDWIAFTSRRAVRAVFDRLDALGLPGNLRLRVAAVGPATAAELAERGIPVHCQPEETTGAALGKALQAQSIDGCRILLPVGDLARPELREQLEAAGATVREVIAYRTLPVLELQQVGAPREAPVHRLQRGDIDIVALASPSAARNLAAMLGADAPLLQHVGLVCIGPTTAGTVRELGFEPAAVAGEQTLDGLVAAIIAANSGGTE